MDLQILTLTLFITNLITGSLLGWLAQSWGLTLRQVLWGTWLILTLSVSPPMFSTLYITGDLRQFIAGGLVLFAFIFGSALGHILHCRNCYERS